jgi:hypothetical protein
MTVLQRVFTATAGTVSAQQSACDTNQNKNGLPITNETLATAKLCADI